ncbi:hypothetical protein RCH18_000200 [Flavobacterium sp. PL11]|nr:hypothetical protein [Flavobacterium sp. PL11]
MNIILTDLVLNKLVPTSFSVLDLKKAYISSLVFK